MVYHRFLLSDAGRGNSRPVFSFMGVECEETATRPYDSMPLREISILPLQPGSGCGSVEEQASPRTNWPTALLADDLDLDLDVENHDNPQQGIAMVVHRFLLTNAGRGDSRPVFSFVGAGCEETVTVS
jgi:hypothetical protein